MQRESPQLQVKGVTQDRPLSPWLNQYEYNSDRSNCKVALAIAVQSGLTVSTLYTLLSGCVVCVPSTAEVMGFQVMHALVHYIE